METIISNPNQAKKIGKVAGGYMVIAESLKLLNKNRSTVLFPIFSAITSFAAIAACVFLFILFSDNAESARAAAGGSASGFIMYAAYFFFYLVTMFVASFFQAGMAIVISAQINGRKMSFGEGMASAAKHTGKILSWALIWATVGVIMNIIEDKTKLAGRIATAILGVAWGLATFFIIPVLVLENGSIDASLKRSVDIFKKKWGETLIANFATSLYFFFIWAVGLVVLFSYLFLGQPDAAMMIVAIALFAAYSAAVLIISATVEGIYRVVLYEYAAHDKIPQDFSQELVMGAMKK